MQFATPPRVIILKRVVVSLADRSLSRRFDRHGVCPKQYPNRLRSCGKALDKHDSALIGPQFKLIASEQIRNSLLSVRHDKNDNHLKCEITKGQTRHSNQWCDDQRTTHRNSPARNYSYTRRKNCAEDRRETVVFDKLYFTLFVILFRFAFKKSSIIYYPYIFRIHIVLSLAHCGGREHACGGLFCGHYSRPRPSAFIFC